MMIVVASPGVLEDWLTLRKRLFDDLDDEFHRRDMAAWLAGPDRVKPLPADSPSSHSE